MGGGWSGNDTYYGNGNDTLVVNARLADQIKRGVISIDIYDQDGEYGYSVTPDMFNTDWDMVLPEGTSGNIYGYSETLEFEGGSVVKGAY